MHPHDEEGECDRDEIRHEGCRPSLELGYDLGELRIWKGWEKLRRTEQFFQQAGAEFELQPASPLWQYTPTLPRRLQSSRPDRVPDRCQRYFYRSPTRIDERHALIRPIKDYPNRAPSRTAAGSSALVSPHPPR